LNGVHQAEVVHGENVWPREHEHEEDLGRPSANALDTNEGRHRFFVREHPERR
jgi:hypothetical protein